MIRFYKPTIKRKDMDSVLQTLVDEEIGIGSRNRDLIQAFSEKTGTYSGYAFRNYKDALVCGLKVLGAQEGLKIALSPLSPSIYLSAIKEVNCEAVYIDVDKENGCPDKELVINSNADILMLYDVESSLPVKYNSETTYANKVEYGNIPILEDVSSSLGSHVLDEIKAGDFGDSVVCCMEDDNMVSSAGGAVLTVKYDLYDKLKLYKPNAFETMTDLNASLGYIQLSNLEENSQKRRDLLKNYQQCLSRTSHKQFGLLLLDYVNPAFSFSVFLDSKPEEAVNFAKKHDVPLRKTFENSVCSVYTGDMFEAFPFASAYYHRTVSFPIYPFLKDSEADMVKKVISHLP